MLKKLRKQKTKKMIWVILAVLILPAFILWGSGSMVRSKQESAYAGKIFGRNISFLEYHDAAEAVRNQMILQFGDAYSEVQKSLDMEALAWDRLILLAEAKKRRIGAGDREIIEAIQKYPLFQRKAKFDERLYLEMLQYVFRAQPRLFEEQIRQNLILSKLYQKLTQGITLTDQEITEEYRKLNEQVSVYYLAALPSEFTKDIAAADEELKNYFSRNQLRFKQPPTFNMEYVSWAEDDKDINAIKNKVQALILKKDNFAKTAAQLGLKVQETGLFAQSDPIPGIGWSEQILALLADAKKGELLPVIQADKNYYLIRLKDKLEPYVPQLEAIKDKVRGALIKEKANEIARAKLETCLKELNKPSAISLEQAARNYGLKSGVTAPFTYSSYIEGIGISDSFWLNASSLKEGALSGIIELPSGFYAIRLKNRTPIDEKKFTAEIEEFRRKLLQQKKEESFAKLVRDLRKNSQRF